MRGGRLHARLDKLMPPTRLGPIVTIFPEDWSTEAQAGYDEATLAGDTDRRAAIILRETGEVVNFDDGSLIKLIEIRTAGYGPA
jgi:hypothetical protein